MIISIDCGSTNFAYCVINERKKITPEILKTGLINIKDYVEDLKKKEKICGIEAYTKSINTLLDWLIEEQKFAEFEYTKVYVEK